MLNFVLMSSLLLSTIIGVSHLPAQIINGVMDSYSCTSFVINENGYVATAGHCVANGKNFQIRYNNQWYPATLIDADYDNDIAILKIPVKFPYVLGLTTLTVNNETVQVIGYPIPDILGTNLKVYTGKLVDNSSNELELNAHACHGNSGGPVLDSNHNTIGVLVSGSVGDGNCSDNTQAQAISHVIDLAHKHNIPVYLNIVPLLLTTSNAEVLENATVLFFVGSY